MKKNNLFVLVSMLVLCCGINSKVKANSIFTRNGLTCDASVHDNFSKDEVIVVVNDNLKKYTINDFEDVGCIFVEELMSDDLYDSPNFKKIIKLKLNTTSKGELLEALNKLENNPYVFYAEPNYYDQIEDDGSRSIHIPKRVGTEIVSSLSESKVNSYALEMINAYDAWNIASGEGVLFGVVDSGIDSSHIDLWGQTSYTYSESFVNNDSDPLSDDIGHGTAIAGVIAAGNNGIGLKGIAYKATLSSLKISNSSTSTAATLSNAIEALNLAILFGVRVINISWGFEYSYSLYQAIINYNKLVVCAAGNGFANIDDSPTYPASYDLDNIITVGAVDEGYGIFASNYGKNSVDLFAPGFNIYSTYLDGMYSNKINYTSIATAYVTGAVALMIEKNPSLSSFSIKNKILNNVTKKASLLDKCTSEGVLNIYAALTA